jgi:hypothetical protein
MFQCHYLFYVYSVSLREALAVYGNYIENENENENEIRVR